MQKSMAKTRGDKKLRVGVLYLQPGDGMAALNAETIENLGYEAVRLKYDEGVPVDLDAVLVWGCYRSLVPLANELLSIPINHRPKLILWQAEQFPNPHLPEWYRRSVGRLRSRLERFVFTQSETGAWAERLSRRRVIRRLVRFRYYGDIFWLRDSRLLTVLVTSSSCTHAFLLERGFAPLLVPLGARLDAVWGCNLGLNRDIDVLWLGSAGSRRRSRLLALLRGDLEKRGISMYVVDGVEHGPVFNEERTVLLNRTRVAVNLLREPWDDNQQRYYLAAACGALIVTEPTLPHSPFVSGEHLVECTVENMSSRIAFFLANEADRKVIADRAYILVSEQLRIERSIGMILDALDGDRQNLTVDVMPS